MSVAIEHGDCLAVLRRMEADSIDACVTDPPYELGFMGKHWDASGVAFQPETWRLVLAGMKPGAHLVAFGGTRTYHRMACAIEDAGFEVRDCLAWMYGQGFPKSLNLGDGRGTALKPAHEPIILARKPFKGSVTANVEKHGTGALNIDACRIESGPDHAEKCASVVGLASNRTGNCYGEWSGEREDSFNPLGRWPANVLLDEIAAAQLDLMSGELRARGNTAPTKSGRGMFFKESGRGGIDGGDSGGASRFFYVAKPSREERDYGCLDQAERSAGACTDRAEGSAGLKSPRAGAGRLSGGRNFHPTVKPVELMRWLVRLITPPGGVVLDPFMGSGTTGMACVYEQRSFIGIEREADYIEIARRRIREVAPLFTQEQSA